MVHSSKSWSLYGALAVVSRLPLLLRSLLQLLVHAIVSEHEEDGLPVSVDAELVLISPQVMPLRRKQSQLSSPLALLLLHAASRVDLT